MGILILLAYLLTSYTALTITRVVFIVSFSEIIKNVIGFIMAKSGIWVVNIVYKN